jgi:hypothetical protein
MSGAAIASGSTSEPSISWKWEYAQAGWGYKEPVPDLSHGSANAFFTYLNAQGAPSMMKIRSAPKRAFLSP